MKELWDAYVALFTWQTGIPIAFYAAIAIAAILYTTSTQNRLKRSIMWGSIGLILAYAFVWLLIASKLNVYARWWIDEDLTMLLAGIPALIIGIIVGVIAWDDADDVTVGFLAGFVTFIIVGFLLLGIFAIGDILFFGIHYILYITALIGAPTLFIAAVYFILSKLNHHSVLLTVFCYLTFCAFVGVIHLLSLTTDHSLNPSAPGIIEGVRSFSQYMAYYLVPLLFLSGPFVLMIIIFHLRQTLGTWVGTICCLFIITSTQLIMVMSPLHNMMQKVFSTSNLILVFIVYAVFSASLVSYYLWKLYRKQVEKKVENLHPLMAIGAVVFNVCFLYPVIASNDRLLWGAWFTGINLLIGSIILFGRLRMLSRKNDRMDIL